MNSAQLTLLDGPPSGCGNEQIPRPDRPWRREFVHLCRVLLVLAIVVLIHRHHHRILAARPADGPTIPLADVQRLFPTAVSLETAIQEVSASPGAGLQGAFAAPQAVRDSKGESLGTIVQTSPASDHILGFSGPTNLLIGFDPDGKIVGLRVLSSGDTREHVDQIVHEKKFLQSFDRRTWGEVAGLARVDGVSGATLTSLAIAESVVHRLGGSPPSLKFPGPPPMEAVRTLFPTAHTIIPAKDNPARMEVREVSGNLAGIIVRTIPDTEQLIGYQGPTETLIGLVEDKIIGLSIGRSYDNEPYVTYVREEAYFLEFFNQKSLKELATMDLRAAGVEGVSGATMTSQTVAAGVQRVAAIQVEERNSSRPAAETEQSLTNEDTSWWRTILTQNEWTLRDYGTMGVTLLGLCFGFSSWRGNLWGQRGLRVLLIVYLGFINGDMVSQALLVGWAKAGIPWRIIGGPLVLTAAALIVPITMKRNIYCSHLCPHGAAQQWLIGRIRWQWHPGPKLRPVLEAIPAILLGVVVVVGMGLFTWSLVDIEPFDAYVIRVAGWTTIAIALVGLLASLVTPMAYCRFGCPTGGLLNYLRRHRRSDDISLADGVALGLLGFAMILHMQS